MGVKITEVIETPDWFRVVLFLVGWNLIILGSALCLTNTVSHHHLGWLGLFGAWAAGLGAGILYLRRIV